MLSYQDFGPNLNRCIAGSYWQATYALFMCQLRQFSPNMQVVRIDPLEAVMHDSPLHLSFVSSVSPDIAFPSQSVSLYIHS